MGAHFAHPCTLTRTTTGPWRKVSEGGRCRPLVGPQLADIFRGKAKLLHVVILPNS